MKFTIEFLLIQAIQENSLAFVFYTNKIANYTKTDKLKFLYSIAFDEEMKQF